MTNSDQPIFTLVSINISDNDAKNLLSKIFGTSHQEAHFVKLKRSAQGRRNILSLLNDPLISKNNIKAGIYYKRYMVIAKAIDLLIEPVAANMGVDLYSDGTCRAMSNMHFICMQGFCGEQIALEFYENLVNMVRVKTDEAIEEFYRHISDMAKSIETEHEEYSHQLMILHETKKTVRDVLEDCDLATLDPAIPAYVDLVSEWGDQLNQEFITLHDKSKILAKYREHLLPLMDKEKPHLVIKIGFKMRTFPLKANDLILVDSKDHEAIQIADIIAGAISHLIRAKVGLISEDDFAKKLNKLNIEDMIVCSVWPSDKIERYEVDVEVVNPADAIASYLHKRKEEDGCN